MIHTQVAILGAGLAGLNAARLLHRAGIDFMLFEARDRPGGRILTADETGQPAEDGFDLGPSWFWPGMQPPIGDLVAELGLASFGQHSEGDVVFERMSREAPHRFPVIDSLCVGFEHVADLAIRGPMVAVGRDPDPQPWGALSFAPLQHVAAAYAAAGARIWNMPEIESGVHAAIGLTQ